MTRPGRCLANVEFHPLNRDEVQAWATQHCVEGVPLGKSVLSNLYALERGQAVKDSSKVGIVSG
jgi:hypothetical protein